MEPNDWNQRYSGGNVPGWDLGRASSVVLRLLPVVHHPPARVLVPGCGLGHEAAALEKRGYKVTALDIAPLAVERARSMNQVGARLQDFLTADFSEASLGTFDLVCEHTLYCAIEPADRDRYVDAAARALRPGGKLFGAFIDFDNAAHQRPGPPFGTSASELLHRFHTNFEVERLEPSSFTFPSSGGAANGGADLPQLEVVFVRR
jgi:SAM-dependent methyltransferase